MGLVSPLTGQGRVLRSSWWLAHTLVYESTILGSLPNRLITSVRVPTLVIDGEQSHELIRKAVQSLAEALPDGRRRTLQVQGYDIVPAAVGLLLEEFFAV